jgi:hypothetical protein
MEQSTTILNSAFASFNIVVLRSIFSNFMKFSNILISKKQLLRNKKHIALSCHVISFIDYLLHRNCFFANLWNIVITEKYSLCNNYIYMWQYCNVTCIRNIFQLLLYSRACVSIRISMMEGCCHILQIIHFTNRVTYSDISHERAIL